MLLVPLQLRFSFYCYVYKDWLVMFTSHSFVALNNNNDSRLTGKGRGKVRYSSSWELDLRATGRHLPYGITQCYLPPDTSERAPPLPQPCRLVLDLPIPEGWKAELT